MRQLQFIEELSFEEPFQFNENEVVYFYNLWICQGCDTATLQEACTAKKLIKNKKAILTYEFHPKRLKDGLHKKLFSLHFKLGILYNEVIESYNNGLVTLCSIGLRALLEGICVDKGITDSMAWGLDKKIDKLGETQNVPASIAKNLKSFKFIGDDAAHRLEVPEPEDLRLSIEVMEELMTFLYSLDYKAQFLFEQIKK